MVPQVCERMIYAIRCCCRDLFNCRARWYKEKEHVKTDKCEQVTSFTMVDFPSLVFDGF